MQRPANFLLAGLSASERSLGWHWWQAGINLRLKQPSMKGEATKTFAPGL